MQVNLAPPETGGGQPAAAASSSDGGQPAAVTKGAKRTSQAAFVIRGEAERQQTSEVWEMTRKAMKERAQRYLQLRGFS